jgi:hypothetical protein
MYLRELEQISFGEAFYLLDWRCFIRKAEIVLAKRRAHLKDLHQQFWGSLYGKFARVVVWAHAGAHTEAERLRVEPIEDFTILNEWLLA